MSVLVTILMHGDAKKFEQIAVDDPNRMRSIADRGKEHGAIAHRFYATDDGDVMVIDEWPDAESFNRFFEHTRSEIGPMREGCAGKPDNNLNGSSVRASSGSSGLYLISLAWFGGK